MGPNMYLYERAREEHCRDLRREIEAQRMISHLPGYRRSMGRRAAGMLGWLLLKLGGWLKLFEQADPLSS